MLQWKNWLILQHMRNGKKNTIKKSISSTTESQTYSYYYYYDSITL